LKEEFFEMILGEKITGLRKSRGMSQELLAENSNISLRTIQRIESGETSPRSFTIKALADALGVPVEALTVDDENIEASNDESVALLQQINFSALAGLVVPFSNIFFTTFFWRKNRSATLVDESGRKIISFQLIWTLATLLLVFVIPTIQYSLIGSFVIGRFPPTIVIVYITMLVLNVLCIIQAARQLQRGQSDIYSFVPSLF
jgi:transcriptional regulator with XRE-family HTH domain